MLLETGGKFVENCFIAEKYHSQESFFGTSGILRKSVISVGQAKQTHFGSTIAILENSQN